MINLKPTPCPVDPRDAAILLYYPFQSRQEICECLIPGPGYTCSVSHYDNRIHVNVDGTWVHALPATLRQETNSHSLPGSCQADLATS